MKPHIKGIAMVYIQACTPRLKHHNIIVPCGLQLLQSMQQTYDPCFQSLEYVMVNPCPSGSGFINGKLPMTSNLGLVVYT